jgi:integrase
MSTGTQRKVRRRGQIVPKGGDLYLAKVFLGRDAGGRRRYASKQFRSRAEAQKWLTAAQREIDLGAFVEPARTTLAEYLDRWLEAAGPGLARRTAYGYAAVLNRYVRGPLGHKRLDRVQPLDVQRLYSAMLARGLSARTVRHTHAALHVALKQAVRWGLLARNPSDSAELPAVPHSERRVLSPDEAVRFLRAAAAMPRGLIFEFALLTGMRPEEYLAVKWSDVDFGRGTAQIKRALVRIHGGWSFEEPKTKKSRRTVTLPAPLVRKLKEHRRAQNELRLKLGGEWQTHDLVFCGETGAPHSIPNLTYRYFRPILEKAGLPRIRLYDLRHSCATVLLIAEENVKVVSERLGHSSVVLTLDTYSHVLPTMQQGAASKLEDLLYEDDGSAERVKR